MSGFEPDAEQANPRTAERGRERARVVRNSGDGIEATRGHRGQLDLAARFEGDAAGAGERRHRSGGRTRAVEDRWLRGVVERDGEPFDFNPDETFIRRGSGHEAVVGSDLARLGRVEDGSRGRHGYRDP